MKKMFASDTNIIINDAVIVIDSSIESMSDDVILIESSIESLNDDIIVIDDSHESVPDDVVNFESLIFVSSMKMLLPQPRTSTPSSQRMAHSAAAATDENDRKCHVNFFFYIFDFVWDEKKTQ